MRSAIKHMPNLTDDRHERLMNLVEIVDRYTAGGHTMTVRQLYYRMVAEGHLDSGESEYRKVQRDARDARYWGLIDFDAIEDRTRNPDSKKTYSDLEELTDVAKRLYVLDRWAGQDYHVELWCEKEALSGVLHPVARRWQVLFSTCKGYTSASAMYEAAQRMQEHEMRGKQNVILYVGDHDPSGLDMERDIKERFGDFSAFCRVPTVRRVALTKGQIEDRDLPPFWAKADDTRSESYVQEHGEECWEVDALPPDQLQSVAEKAIRDYVDRDKYEEVKEQEQADIERFEEALEDQNLV